MNTRLLTCLLLLLGSTLGSLRVYAPNYLATKYDSVSFASRLSSFGRIPYGHTILGEVKIPFPDNACGTTVKVDHDFKSKDPLILLVLRGNCTFLEKVQNAQKLKASMVLVVDDRIEDMRFVLPWADDAPHLNVMIPSVIIDGENGSKLMDDVRKASNDKSTSVVASFSFNMEQAHNSTVVYKFDLNERGFFETLFELHETYKDVKSLISITPIYNIAPVQANLKPQGTYCLNGTTFCETRTDKPYAPREDQAVFESIRQLCLAKQAPEAWWKYVVDFYKECQHRNPDNNSTYLEKNLAECSKGIVNRLDNQAKEKLAECYSGVTADDFVKQGSTLERLLVENYQTRIRVESPLKPTVVINGQILYGRVQSIDILKEICASLLTKPNSCVEIDKLTHSIHVYDKERFSFFTALWYLIKLILVGAIMTGAFYLMFKIKLRRDMEKKLNNEVDSALANYYMQNKSSRYEGVQVEENEDNDASKISLGVEEQVPENEDDN